MSTYQQNDCENVTTDRKEQEKKQSWKKTADIVAAVVGVSGLILFLGVIMAFAVLIGKFAQGIVDNRTSSEVYPGIFVGGINSVMNHGLGLANEGIINVLNVTTTPDPEEIRNGTFLGVKGGRYHYLQIPVKDTPFTNISQYFPVTNQFISSALARGEPVLVHCHSGISRSVTVVVAYLISLGMTPAYALKLIKNVRPNSYPNPGFRQQLENYYHSLYPAAP